MLTNLTMKSSNRKVGPIPVSTSSCATCPGTCPFKSAGCYADGGPLAILWRDISEGRKGDDWETFCNKIEALPAGQLWRHNQAGDLPGEGNDIDERMMLKLVEANEGKRGFTYTHKPMTTDNAMLVMHANEEGFTVNLSANNLKHADELADRAIGPVVVVLPHDQTTNTVTPKGRKVVVCPAVTRDDVSCSTCALCARADRKVIVGFPAHGMRKAKASAISLS